MSGMNFSQFVVDNSTMAEAVGSKTAEGGFEKPFQLAEGWHPATLISTGNADGLPWASASTQYKKNGSLRLPFNLLVDGTVEYIVAGGVPADKLDAKTILNYVVTVSRNLPMDDRHPPVKVPAPNGQGEVAAAWTKDPAQIKKYSREPGRMMYANGPDGQIQTFYGTFFEAGAVQTDLKTKEVSLNWTKLAGARVFVLVNKDGYGVEIKGKSLDDEQRDMIGTREAPKVDPTYLTAAPSNVVKFKAMRFDKNAASATATGPAAIPVPPKTEATPGLKTYMLSLIKLMTDGDPSAKALVPVFQAALRDAAAHEGTTGSGKFSELHTDAARMEILGNLVKILVSAGISLPEVSSDEPWATVVSNAADIAQATDANSLV